ncbi:HGL176Wp [Eremothecium sinecaudum]|uniref:HGL176Wp n=1 Tax=Eremothecium sinecaudum TaxID=45286 RepID=A0A0X8HVG6_9SACH|nr:HGL176Wp [Eremothecium sinecaudum]AMD22164.1 HGL176Wp [Eremothecium sinecaudum]
MKLLVPISDLDLSLETPLEELETLHCSRRFVIFDENLPVYLHYNPTSCKPKKLTVNINEAVVYEGSDASIWKAAGPPGFRLWKLDEQLIRNKIFHTNLCMNNSNKNRMTLKLEYQVIDENEVPTTFVPDNEILPTFKQLKLHEKRPNDVVNENVLKEEFVSLPIHTLLTMRLRNLTLSSRNTILSSLDFQASMAICEFIPDPEMMISSIRYELVDDISSVVVYPMWEIEFPLTVTKFDSHSINYQLPENKNRPHRVRITVEYQLKREHQMHPIVTVWDTEVSLRKTIQTLRETSLALPSQPSTGYTTPYIGSTASFAGPGGFQRYSSSASCLHQSGLKLGSGVTFKIRDLKEPVPCGREFPLILQIDNASTFSLNLVIYYSSVRAQQSQDIRLKMNYEGIILLSNDYKVPPIAPGETYEVELNCIGIIPGYYHNLRGLKVVNLDTNEVIHIGRNVSITII